MTNEKDEGPEPRDERLEPRSMHPLDPKDALRGFMKVDPEKVKERLEAEGDRDDG